MSPSTLVGVAAVGLVAGVVNTLAGAGSLVTLPALMLLGVPAPVANATNRVGVVLQSAAACASMSRADVLEVSRGPRLMVPAALGALGGAWLSARLDPALFKDAIGVGMIVVLLSLYLPWRRYLPATKTAIPPAARFVIYLAIGAYGGFLQAGVGLYLLAALQITEGLDLVRSNAIKALLVLTFTVVSLGVFGLHGLIDLPVAGALAVGSLAGGALGARLSVQGGERLIRAAVTVAVLGSLAALWAQG